MLYIAYLLLTRNKQKYLGIILGLTFTSFIMTQPLGIFLGNVELTYGLITDINIADIWVMHPKKMYLQDAKSISKPALYRVGSIKGVKWAKPLLRGVAQVRNKRGIFQLCRIIGVDDPTFIGAPVTMVRGLEKNLHYPNGVIVDEESARNKLAHSNRAGGATEPLPLGESLEINGHRALVVGTAKVTRTFESDPTLYTTCANAALYDPALSRSLSFILVKANPGENLEALCERITKITGLRAHTKNDFKKATAWYYFRKTGLILNFWASLLIAFIAGGVITGQMFYNFNMEHLRYFGLLKAMGSSKETLCYMILFQAFIVSLVGSGMGIGMTALVALSTRNTMLVFSFPAIVFIVSIFGILFISFFTAFIIVRRVVPLEPAIIFRN